MYILAHLQAKKKEREKRFEEARAAGELEECGCCYDDEVMREDMLECPNKHRFCRECVRRGAETAIGKLNENFFLDNCTLLLFLCVF